MESNGLLPWSTSIQPFITLIHEKPTHTLEPEGTSIEPIGEVKDQAH